MFESINTLLLTLSLSRDRDRADSLRPKELRFDRTTHLGFMAIRLQVRRVPSLAAFFLW